MSGVAIPKAVTWLNYRGDVTAAVPVGTRMGPNTLKEHLWVVSAEYDLQRDQTRVGFTYLNPAGWLR